MNWRKEYARFSPRVSGEDREARFHIRDEINEFLKETEYDYLIKVLYYHHIAYFYDKEAMEKVFNYLDEKYPDLLFHLNACKGINEEEKGIKRYYIRY